jgi:hypothetical protein
MWIDGFGPDSSCVKLPVNADMRIDEFGPDLEIINGRKLTKSDQSLESAYHVGLRGVERRVSIIVDKISAYDRRTSWSSRSVSE